MQLPQRDSVTERGVKTSLQAMSGFLIGLIVAIWGVPGVPEAIVHYLSTHIIELTLMVGIPSGLVSVAWNLIFRKDLPKT